MNSSVEPRRYHANHHARSILSKVKFLRIEHAVQWRALAETRDLEHFRHFVRQEMMRTLGRDFAVHAMERAEFQVSETPLAQVHTAHAYCLGYHELCGLLEEAFEAGQRDASSRLVEKVA